MYAYSTNINLSSNLPIDIYQLMGMYAYSTSRNWSSNLPIDTYQLMGMEFKLK